MADTRSQCSQAQASASAAASRTHLDAVARHQHRLEARAFPSHEGRKGFGRLLRVRRLDLLIDHHTLRDPRTARKCHTDHGERRSTQGER